MYENVLMNCFCLCVLIKQYITLFVTEDQLLFLHNLWESGSKCDTPITGVYMFLTLLLNIGCGCSLEPHRRGGSNVYPRSMF